MKKLEPLLPIPRKTGKFQSPYKSLQKVKTTSKDNGNQGPTTTSFPNQQLNIAAQTSKTLITQTGNKLGEERSEDLVNAKVLPNLPKASPVKIQPIDPYQFCEPFLTDCLKSTVPQKDTMFKRSKEAQVCVGNAFYLSWSSSTIISTIILNQHPQPSSSAIILNHHPQPSSSTIILNHHPQPASSTSILNHHPQPSSSTSITTHSNSIEPFQSKVNREILTLIKRTAEAIKQIRSQHEEWKRINIKVKN